MIRLQKINKIKYCIKSISQFHTPNTIPIPNPFPLANTIPTPNPSHPIKSIFKQLTPTTAQNLPLSQYSYLPTIHPIHPTYSKLPHPHTTNPNSTPCVQVKSRSCASLTDATEDSPTPRTVRNTATYTPATNRTSAKPEVAISPTRIPLHSGNT